MTIANVTAEDGTLTVPRQARTAALTPVAAPAPDPAGRERAVLAVPAGRPKSRYWQAVTRYLEDYRESYDPGAAGAGGQPAYRSPAQAAEAAARFRADAEAAADLALRAQRDTRAAAGRLEAAAVALEKAPAWQWRVRARLRAEAHLEQERRAAALRDLDGHSAAMEHLLRQSRRSERIAAVLRRSDRAHLAAAGAAARTAGWRPGNPLPARSAVYVAGRDGIEALPAIAQR